MSEIGSAHLPYGPIDQNSNSAYCTALTAAGLQYPNFASFDETVLGGHWVPGCATTLPTSYTKKYLQSELQTGTDVVGNPTVTVTEITSGTTENTVILAGSSESNVNYSSVTLLFKDYNENIDGQNAVSSASNKSIFVSKDTHSLITYGDKVSTVIYNDDFHQINYGDNVRTTLMGQNNIVDNYGENDIAFLIGVNGTAHNYGSNDHYYKFMPDGSVVIV
jgi:hypothetical protein